jgi:TIR domain
VSQTQVFISYAREDINAAQRLYNELKNAGLVPWMDKYSILPGQNWDIEIKKAITSAYKKCFLFNLK